MRLGIFIAMLWCIAHPASAAEEYDMKADTTIGSSVGPEHLPDPKPVVGGIVHFEPYENWKWEGEGRCPYAQPRAGIVTSVDPNGTAVNLCVLDARDGFQFKTYVFYSEEIRPGTWRWPPRVEEKASEKPSDVLPILEESIARIAHEANRAYCLALGDDSQPAWDDAPEWQRTSAINGVKFHLQNPGASPSASHDNWLAEKLEQGWKYGPVKDPEKREHPCCVPYDQLPVTQQLKDKIFSNIVRAFV